MGRKKMCLPGFGCRYLNFIFTRKINPSDRLNSTVKARIMGNQSQQGRCHSYAAITLCNKHLVQNDKLKQKSFISVD